MALTAQELIDIIEENLPDNQAIPIAQLRAVLETIVNNTSLAISEVGGILPLKFGMTWIKGKGNVDLGELEEGDELEGVGDLYGDGYWTRVRIHTLPVDEVDPDNSVTVLIGAPIPSP